MNLLSLWLACTGPPTPPTETSTPSETDTVEATGDTADMPPVAGPILTSPAEAADADPDPSVLHVVLTAHHHGDGYAYNGQVPGPTLRGKLGDTLIVDLTNDLTVPTTIHWHGLSVLYAMDGVTWQTDPVAAGASFRYTFELTQAGTFWYHPHFDTERQVDLGLYGVLVVEDPADPVADDELIIVLDALAEVRAAKADPHQVDPTLPVTLNGLTDPIYVAPEGGTVRVRMVNASGSRAVWLQDVHQIGGDQGLLHAAHDGHVVIAPGDRVELQWRVGAPFEVLEAPYAVAGGPAFGEARRLLTVEAVGVATEPEGLPWPFGGQAPSADPGHTTVRLLFSGSVEGGWEINGETFPDVTVPTLDLGTDTVIEVRNVSPAEHPFHLHGHTFEVLSVDGVAPDHRSVEDTLMIGMRSVARLRFTADNPGSWMTHCHILPHADSGMMTVIDVR